MSSPFPTETHRMKKAWPLRRQLICLAALALLPLALAGAWGMHVLFQQQQREVERSALDLSRALALAVDGELDATVSSLRSMSYSPLLQNSDIPGFYEIAQNALAAQPNWSGISLSTPDGHVLFKAPIPLESGHGAVLDLDSHHQVLETMAPVVGKLMKGQLGQMTVPVRVPVFRNGAVAYILTGAVKPSRIVEILQRQNLPDNWIISVFDASGMRVARSSNHEQTVGTRGNEAQEALLRRPAPEATGVVPSLEGYETITGFTRLPSYRWAVAVSIPTASLKTTLWQTVLFYVLAALVSIGVCAAFAVGISRRLLLGVAHLRAQAEKLGRDEPVAAGYTAVAELNEVGEALKHASRDRLAAERERQELLASLHAALERAEEAGRAKDQFLAMLGHELRNPLAPIVAALELMQLKADAATAREREIMGRHITHMTRLIGDLLDVARIVQGKLRMRNEVVNLRSVVERALEASQEPADIRVEIEPGEVWVRGDDTRLFQVVTNLLSNALRYCPHGEVRLHLWIEGQQARIAVHDKGVGMTPETAARVFDTFFQAPQSVARASGGLGLGLAIVRTIVDMHGGKVSARSAGPGQGSTFEVALPLAAGPEPKQQQALPAKVAQGGEVLVVDDNADAAATLGELLRLTGYSVRLAHSAAEGLTLFAERAPDAAILDIGLPDMDGLALARSLRERYPDWRGALVALSGYGQDGDKARAQEAGFDLHLTKPADPQELMASLGQLISRKMQNEGITQDFLETH